MLLAKLREQRGDGAEVERRGEAGALERAVATGAARLPRVSEADV
jgi:hypothetical protein